MCTIPASGNRIVWVKSFQPSTNSDQYSFQILICQMDTTRFTWQKRVTKMCPKYLLTLHQNWLSQYQIHINRIGDINNVQKLEVFTLYAKTNISDTRNISCSILTRHVIRNIFSHFVESFRSWAIVKIKIKKLDNHNYFSLILKTKVIFRKLVKCWKITCEIMKNWAWWHILFIS